MFIKIYKEILNEFPEYDTPEREAQVQEIFKEATRLECEWAKEVIGDKISGLDYQDIEDYVHFYANVRCNQMGYERPFEGYRKNPMKWIKAYEDVDLGKTDFFENKSRQYVKVGEDNGFDDL